MGLSSPDQVDLVSNATPRLNQTLPCPNSKISTLNPSLQNEIENENLGLPEKDIGSQGPRKKIVKKGFHGRLLHLLEMNIRSDLIIPENGILVSKSEEGVEFHIGDGYLCPALSKAVKTMSKGEKAELASIFFKKENMPQRPWIPNTSVAVASGQINVLKFRFPDTQSAFNFHSSEFWTEITISGKLEACERKKLDGNVLFKAGKFRRAS
ncbi:hypothetical protein NC652_036055 [Populus alba x Populus x berolinensis]|nr:hypothetical protein NC652_036055 [Populus alba x Populus x berolinensis]